MRINHAAEVVAHYSRLGMCGLVALKRVAQVMLVVHVTLGAQVIVKAHLALPSHSHDAMLLAAVTDDVGMADSWSGKRVCWVINVTSLWFLIYFCFKEIHFIKELAMLYSKYCITMDPPFASHRSRHVVRHVLIDVTYHNG